jgi:hypothetical protein
VIEDEKLMRLLEKIIFSGCSVKGKGIPIGNLTSQYFANYYLSNLDHYIKDYLGVKSYIRYMDDFVIFDDDKEYLKKLLSELRIFIRNELMLELKESATFINSRENGLGFLGWRIFPNLIKINNTNLKRSLKNLRCKEREYLSGTIDDEKLLQSSSSIMGHIKYFNTFKLCENIFNKG